MHREISHAGNNLQPESRLFLYLLTAIAESLERIGPKAEDAVAALFEALKDPGRANLGIQGSRSTNPSATPPPTR